MHNFFYSIYALSPACLNVLTCKLSKSSDNWTEEERIIGLINAELSTLHSNEVAVLDAGLIDVYNRVFNKEELFGESYAGGKINAIKVGFGDVPTLNDMFVATSTVASWLALKESNVVLLQALTHTRMNILIACVMMYCADTIEFDELGKKINSWYTQLVYEAESLGQHIHKALGGQELKNTVYYGEFNKCTERPVARFVRDFACLMRKRDKSISDGVSNLFFIKTLVTVL